MKNTYFKARGAIGFKKGLGVDEIEFDLSDKTGLVALSGPNGKGKTTFLELMSLYRTLASRKGSLKHHFFLRDSVVEHKFIYGGDEYHIIWKIDSGSDRSEAFILVNGESIVNGKNTEYDKYIVDKFGSANLFYNSVFCAQGSENMAGMTAGKIKDLFIEFLQIERLEEFRKTSKFGVDYYQTKLDKISGRIEACQNDLESLKEVEGKITLTKNMISIKDDDIQLIDKEIEKNDIEIKKMEAKAGTQAAGDVKRKEITAELKRLIRERDNVKNKSENMQTAFNGKRTAYGHDIDALDSILRKKDKIFNAAAEIKILTEKEKHFSDFFECTIEEQAEINRGMKEAEKEKFDCLEKIEKLDDDLILDGLITTVDYFRTRRHDVEKNKNDLDQKLLSEKNNFSLIQAEQVVESCKENIALSIDPDCTSESCPAIDMVSNAKLLLPELEKKLEERKEKNEASINWIETHLTICDADLIDIKERLIRCLDLHDEYFAGNQKKISSLEEDSKKIEDKKEMYLSDYLAVDEFKIFYKSKRDEIRDGIKDLEDLSSKKTKIQITEEKKRSLKSQIDQENKAFREGEKELADQFDKLSTDILTRERICSLIDKDLDLDIYKKIEAAVIKKIDLVKYRKGLIPELEGLKANAAVLKNNLIKKEELTIDLKSKNQEKKAFEKEMAEWDYLRLACSKTGLQALEIDGASPLIAAEANTLLEKAFGLDSQIRIVTQDEETGREVFQIKVIRADGAEDDFQNLSGGQKVWIAKALSLGMTLISKRKSGRKFETLYADEEAGSLDDEKALEFVQLYRSIIATGDFETCYFISHNTDVVNMADHVIDFGAL